MALTSAKPATVSSLMLTQKATNGSFLRTMDDPGLSEIHRMIRNARDDRAKEIRKSFRVV